MEHVEHKLDGNAAAGALGEIFRFEATTAQTLCAYCGATGSIGGQAAYVTGMGVVVRCAGCDGALIRLANTPKTADVQLFRSEDLQDGVAVGRVGR